MKVVVFNRSFALYFNVFEARAFAGEICADGVVCSVGWEGTYKRIRVVRSPRFYSQILVFIESGFKCSGETVVEISIVLFAKRGLSVIFADIVDEIKIWVIRPLD